MRREGRIIRAISGFYYVKTSNAIFECRAKGALKNDDILPLVGDFVAIETEDGTVKSVSQGIRPSGVISEVKPRKNELFRPAVANVDQVMAVFAIKNPNPNLSLLDRFIALMKKQNVPVILVFTKKDLAKGNDIKNLQRTYARAGCRMFFTKIEPDKKHGLFLLKHALKGKTTVLAGPSGVGKSTLVNFISGNEALSASGVLSAKTGRGKHTTRKNELFEIKKGINIIDTPGFSALLTNDFSREELKGCFPEFNAFASQCPFADCSHIKERDCAVRKAAETGKIPLSRYNTYKSMYGEIRGK